MTDLEEGTHPKKLDVLIKLHHGYGLGDAVQMSAVLRHVAKYRPNWSVDYAAPDGQHQVGRGIVAGTSELGKPYPRNHYDAEVQVCLYDTWSNWHDRPNTRVSSCLHEVFGLGWDSEYGRYQVKVSRDASYAAVELVSRLTSHRKRLSDRPVAVHWRGDSSPMKKNLTVEQAAGICDAIRKMKCEPCVLGRHIPNGHNAEVNCAVINQCSAFVGIDSGPSKCASATDTPALVIWTGHHPAPFHDPAPNTTHLVPRGYHGLYPVCNDSGVIRWFEDHHKVRQYEGDPVEEVKKWLMEKLK